MSPVEAVAHLTAAGVVKPSIKRGIVAGERGFYVVSGVKSIGHGVTLRDALAHAGFPAPDVSQFANEGCAVKLGSAEVATARSATMATRIARALNVYKPGPRGY